MEHYPVLLNESLEWLAIDPAKDYLDATGGLGNHTMAIAAKLTSGIVVSADRDGESQQFARERSEAAGLSARVRFLASKFSDLPPSLKKEGLGPFGGALADLGVSRYQLTDPARGFSLQNDGPLDMRMNRSDGETASDIVNYSSEKELADLIYKLAEERRSRQISRAIVKARPIRSTAHLAAVVESASARTGRIHPATLTFLALRRAVNQEEEELNALLEALPALVSPGGRVVVITFMSIEDRIVKHYFTALQQRGICKILTKKVVTPSDEELRANAASRSAKLRSIEIGGR